MPLLDGGADQTSTSRYFLHRGFSPCNAVPLWFLMFRAIPCLVRLPERAEGRSFGLGTSRSIHPTKDATPQSSPSSRIDQDTVTSRKGMSVSLHRQNVPSPLLAE